MTVAEIESRVDKHLNRVGVSDVATTIAAWVQEELRQWAENATWPVGKAVDQKVPGRQHGGEPHNWSFLTTTYDFATTASLQTYSLSAATGFLRPIRLWLECVDGDRVTYMDLEVLRQMNYGRNPSYPEHYGLAFSEDGTTLPTLWLFPAPLEAWTGHLTYAKKATAVSGGQSNIFTIRWPEGIIAGAVARGIRLLRGYAEAAEWVEEQSRMLAAAIASDRGAQSEAGMTLGISTVADGDPEHPRPILEDYPFVRKIDPESYY